MSQINPKFNNTATADKIAWYKEDFLGSGIANTSFATSGTGTGNSFAIANNLIVGNRWGIVAASTGTTTTGRGSGSAGTMQLGASNFTCEMAVYLPTLSTVTDEYIFDIGIHDQNASSTAPTEGVYIRYDRLTSTNWLTATANASTTTTTTTTTSVTAATWFDLRININSANTSVTFYINGTLVATHTTNIPSGGSNVRPVVRIIKSAGTTASTVHTDFFNYQANFNTAR